jgi:hypothetical protein
VTAGIYDVTLEQGATFTRTITYNTSAGSPVDLTGFTAEMDLRPSYNSSTVVLTLTTANGRIALGGAAGTITLTVTAADMAALTAPADGVYDLELSSGGSVTRLLQGTWTISPEATR